MPVVYDPSTDGPTTPADEKGMDDALARFSANVAKGESATHGIIPTLEDWVSPLTGADVGAAQSSADAGVKLLAIMQAKRPTIHTHNAALAFVFDVNEYTPIGDILETMQRASPLNEAKDVAVATASDVAAAAETGLKFGIPLALVAGVAVVGFLVWRQLPRKA
jgi:hypothetical protein